MADTSDPDGLKNTVSGQDSDDPPVCGVQSGSEVDLSTPSSLNSSPKRAKMDGDGDGAPNTTSPPTISPRHTNAKPSTNGDGDGSSTNNKGNSHPRLASSGGARSSSRGPTTPQAAVGDLSNLDMKTSWDGSAISTGSGKGEQQQRGSASHSSSQGAPSPQGGGSSGGSPGGYVVAWKARAGMLADPVKIAKEREKEERVRQARERLAEERKRKLDELKEQQKIAQENREKQLEMRRKKIEDLRKRDVERRAAVEERRKLKEEMERARRESILQKAEERVARYEAWKAGGRKGVFGEGVSSKLSVSTSVLYHKRHPDFSSTSVLSPACGASGRPESTLALHTIREGSLHRSVLGLPQSASGGSYYHYARPSSATTPTRTTVNPSIMTTSMPSPVRLRQSAGSRKQRPASVASSMPSFVGGEAARSPRSKSTDRAARDRSKNRPNRRDEKAAKDKENEANRACEDTPDGDDKGAKRRVNKSFFDRLSTPKFHKSSADAKDLTPRKDAPIFRLSPRKAYSTTNLATMRKRSSLRENKPSLGKDSTLKPTPAKDSPKPSSTTSTPRGAATSTSSTPRGSASRGSSATRGGPSTATTPRTPVTTPTAISSPARAASPCRASSPVVKGSTSGPSTPRVSSPTPANSGQAEKVSEDGNTPTRPATSAPQDITAEEYKARLAEKRRQAREKAEREAEEERKRQEEERLAEEERLRQEEEEQQRLEEETLRLAEEARKAEEERLQRAIEAEEKRKKEEAERLEQEKKAKEEADRKSREEAERLEQEKQERARREEEERLQRKKKLEMIMKRVKPADSAPTSESSRPEGGSPTKVVHSSPNLTSAAIGSGHSSPTEEHNRLTPVEVGGQETTSGGQEEAASTLSITPPATIPETGNATTSDETSTSTSSTAAHSGDEELAPDATSTTTTTVTQVVRSASSGDILDSGTQQMEATTTTTTTPDDNGTSVATPARLSEDADSKPRFKSPLLQQLVENKGSAGDSSPKFKSPLLQNLLGKTKVGARIGLSASMGDLSPGTTPSSTITTSSTKEFFKQGLDEDKDEDTLEGEGTSSKASLGLTNGGGVVGSQDSSMQDSALGSSLGPQQSGEGGGLYNGHLSTHSNGAMEDSSLGLQQSVENPQESLEHPADQEGSGQFEEIIDLLDTGKSPPSVATAPIIAFDQNRMPDVTESLS